MNKIQVDFAEDIGKRPYMEDRIIIEPNMFGGWSLFAVCDGHGGSYVCNFLKFHLKDILVEQLQNTTELIPAIRSTFKRITGLINLEESTFQGSTVCAVLLNGNMLVTVNIGDSRAVVGLGEESLDITRDHKPSEPQEEERITKAGGFVSRNPMDVPRVNGHLAVSRSVGDFYLFPYVTSEPEINAFNLESVNEYYVAIGTDGIWDVYNGSEIIKLLSAGATAQDIVNLSSQRGSMDNMSIVTLHKTLVH